MPRLRRVIQIFVDLLIGEAPAEPRAVPEQKRKEHEEQSESGDQQVGALSGAPRGTGGSLHPETIITTATASPLFHRQRKVQRQHQRVAGRLNPRYLEP